MAEKLKKRLVELGESLASPPSSVDELYELLDQINGVLSTVEQSPSPTIFTALQPLMTALSVEDFLRHSDLDVKAVVASCISEITRITAPDAPYDDDNMKEIFQMIVETFEGLDQMASRSFQKRVSILETVAKFRSCVVILDLECDALILEMFHNFLKTIRTYHSENVFSCMETIMTLVIEESDDISTELLSILLDTLRNNTRDVLSIAQRLAEKVMSNCATKIKPCLLPLVRSKDAPLSEYHKVVASICQENDMLDHFEANAPCEVVGKRKAKRNASQMPQTKKPKPYPKSHEQSKSGTEASDKRSPWPRGRFKKGTSNHGKLFNDGTLETPKKSERKCASDDKAKTPRSNGKLKDASETEPVVKTPRTNSKREESGNKSKDSTSKISDKSKDETSKSGKKAKSETPKAITGLKVCTSEGRGKSADNATTRDSPPITDSRSKAGEVAKNRIPKIGTDYKTSSLSSKGKQKVELNENVASLSNDKATTSSVSSKGKRKVEENENVAPLSDDRAATGGKERKRKGRKVKLEIRFHCALVLHFR